MNLRAIGREHANQPGPYVLACSHLGHVEPFLVATVMRRKIDFVARIEFYRSRIVAFLLRSLDAIKVNRQGVSVSTIRTSLDRLRRGRIVGIFPEGGVSRGAASVCVGGPIKLGATLIACRAGVPIIPCVVLGSHELSKIGPWLPFKHAYVWMAFGEPIAPVNPGRTRATRRAAYAEMGKKLQASMMLLYHDLSQRYNLPDAAGETFAERDTASSPYAPPRGSAMRSAL